MKKFIKEITESLDEEEILINLAKVMGILFLGQGVCLLIYGLISSINGAPLIASMVYKSGYDYNAAHGTIEYIVALGHIAVILGAFFCDLIFEKKPKFLIVFFALEFLGCGILKLVVLIGALSPLLIIVFAVIFVAVVPISGVLLTSTLIPTLLIIPGLGAAIMSAICGVVVPFLSIYIILQALAELFL